MAADTNGKYEEALGNALSKYADRDFSQWMSVADQFQQPWMAVINCAAFFLAIRARQIYQVHNRMGYGRFEWSSIMVWANLAEDNVLKALVHIVDVPDRTEPRTLTWSWIPTDDKGGATNFSQASGGTLTLLDDSGGFEQIKTIVTPGHNGRWVVWDRRAGVDVSDQPPAGWHCGFRRWRGGW